MNSTFLVIQKAISIYIHVYLQDHGLIERQGNVEEKSREERKQMNLDRKRLKELRHEQKSQSKKRKVSLVIFRSTLKILVSF